MKHQEAVDAIVFAIDCDLATIKKIQRRLAKGTATSDDREDAIFFKDRIAALRHAIGVLNND